MNTTYIMECGEVSCEYCTKDKCIYMKDTETESENETKCEEVMKSDKYSREVKEKEKSK